jgi:hypothetical protein
MVLGIPWYETEEGRARLMLERAAISRRFPQFKEGWLKDRRLCFEGEIRSNKGNFYSLMLVYPENYLHNPEIEVYLLTPTGSGVPHMHSNGRLCLYKNPSDFASNRTTGATYIARAWIAAYEVWKTTGKWSGKGL